MSSVGSGELIASCVRSGNVLATGKPDTRHLHDFDNYVLASLPPPCKPDAELVLADLPLDDGVLGVHGVLEDSEEDIEDFESLSLLSWVRQLRSPSTSSLTPRFQDVPSGTFIAPDGRAHWSHVLNMSEFCQDLTSHSSKPCKQG